jgi:hypothetical protein
VKTDREIAKVLGALDVEQAIGNDPIPRCMPDHVISFHRGADEVANASYMCGAGGTLPAQTTASFMIFGATRQAEPIALGTIKLDPRVIRDVAEGK